MRFAGWVAEDWDNTHSLRKKIFFSILGVQQAFREYELLFKAPIGLEFPAVLPHLAQRTQTTRCYGSRFIFEGPLIGMEC